MLFGLATNTFIAILGLTVFVVALGFIVVKTIENNNKKEK